MSIKKMSIFDRLRGKDKRDENLEDIAMTDAVRSEEPEEKKEEYKTGFEGFSDQDLLYRFNETLEIKNFERKENKLIPIKEEISNRLEKTYSEHSLVVHIGEAHLMEGEIYPGTVSNYDKRKPLRNHYDKDAKEIIESIYFDVLVAPFNRKEKYNMRIYQSLTMRNDIIQLKDVVPVSKEEFVNKMRYYSMMYISNLDSNKLSEAMRAREYAFCESIIEQAKRWNPKEGYFRNPEGFSNTHFVLGIQAGRKSEECLEEYQWRDMTLKPIVSLAPLDTNNISGLIRCLDKNDDFRKELGLPKGFYFHVFDIPKDAEAIIERNNPVEIGISYKRRK